MSVSDKVLLAVYVDFLCFSGQTAISSKSLGLREDVYNYAIARLAEEGKIEGVGIMTNPTDLYPPYIENFNLRITEKGLGCVGALLGADNDLFGADALKQVYRFAAEREWYSIADLAILALFRSVPLAGG